MTASQVASPERMQCMEVWGGNSPVDRDFTTPGLQVWLHSCPYEHAEKGGDVYYASVPAEIIPRLLERLSQEHASNLSQDDATALLFRADGSNVSLKNKLLAPFRLLSAVRDETVIVS